MRLLAFGAALAIVDPSCAQVSLPVSIASSAGPARPGEVGSFEIQLQPLQDTTSPPVVTALAASRDGRFLAAAGDDHAIRVIDVPSGKELGTFAGHVDWIQSLAFAYASEAPQAVAPLLYSAGNDGRILEWKYAFPVAAREVVRLPFAVRSISVSSSQQLLAMAGFAGEVLVWDLAQDQLLHRLACASADQRCVKFSPDGLLLLSGGRDGEVRVWDSRTGAMVAEYQLHRGRVTTAAFSSDGSKITSVGEDRRLIRFDLATSRAEVEQELGNSKMMSMCLINERLVATAGADSKIRLFDTAANAVVAELEGHWGTVAVMEPCGEFLASGSFDTTVRIWDLQRIGRQGDATGRPVSHAPMKMDAELQIR